MNQSQILNLIEWISMGAEEVPEKQTNADKLLLEIYKIVHSHREDACCKDVHQNWRDEAKKTFEDNKEYF